MRDPEHQIKDVEELVSYSEANAGTVIYIDNDCVSVYDPSNSDVWTDLDPREILTQAMTYDEAVTAWALKKYGDKKISYIDWEADRSLITTTFGSVVDINHPIELVFQYDEGYCYSEYTNADSTFYVHLSYVRKGSSTVVRTSLSIYENETVPLAEITKEILEISLQ